MALLNAREDPRISSLIGQLVRLEVMGAGFDIRAASSEEAETFWQARQAEVRWLHQD